MSRIAKSLVLLCSLMMPLPAAAQAASVEDKLSYILEIGDFTKTIDVVMDGFRPMIIAQLRKTSDKITPEIADHVANIMVEQFSEMKPEFRAFVIDFYKKQMSEEEVDALYAFYKTPVGASVGRKMNKIMENLIPQVQTFMALHFLPKFQARLAKDERLRRALSP